MRTDTGSAARLDFDDGAVLRFGENTNITLETIASRGGSAATRLSLEGGQVWLSLRGRGAEARASLERLGVADPEAMLAEFQRADAAARGAARLTLFCATHRRPILLAILLAMFNQLSGINAILYYLNDIFAAAGFSGTSQDLQAVAVGAANLVSVLNPELIVLGGYVPQAGDFFLEALQREIALWAHPVAARKVRIEVSQLGQDAGLLGAAWVSMNPESR